MEVVIIGLILIAVVIYFIKTKNKKISATQQVEYNKIITEMIHKSITDDVITHIDTIPVTAFIKYAERYPDNYKDMHSTKGTVYHKFIISVTNSASHSGAYVTFAYTKRNVLVCASLLPEDID